MEKLSETQLNAISDQLAALVHSGNVAAYLENNVNYEADLDLEERTDTANDMLARSIQRTAFVGMHPQMLSAMKAKGMPQEMFGIHFLGKFGEWLRRSKLIRKVRKGLCQFVDKIKELIDEEATVKRIVEVVLLAALTAVGLTLNPLVITVAVALLATMILQGVDHVCVI